MNLNKHTFVAKMSYVVKYALFKGVLMKITTLSPQKLILGGEGGIFLQSLIFQAFSDVMVIIDEASTLQRGQFANSGPHPAILLLTQPIEK